MYKNLKFQKLKNWSKIDINHLQDLKNVRKIIFNDSRTNLVQNCILKKKSCHSCPNILKIPDFLNFPKSQNGRNWPIIIPKHWLCPKVFPKCFFVSQTQKFMKIFPKNHTPPPKKKGLFGGRGVMILKVVFAGFDAAW